MGANDKNLDIIKKAFGGDAGKQGAYFRELFEVLLLERKGVVISEEQQAEIDKRIAKAEIINKQICLFLGTKTLEEMIPEEVEVEE